MKPNRKSSSRFNWQLLKPRGYGDLGVEELEGYCRRTTLLVPNIPIEVLQDWIYRHYNDAVRDYSWLDVPRLNFEKQVWATQQIVSQLRPREERQEKSVEGWNRVFQEESRMGRTHRQSKLGAFMLEHGTWPVAPLIVTEPEKLGAPAEFFSASPVLIEGHHRLAYLRALSQMLNTKLLPDHPIWVINGSKLSCV